MNVNRGVRTSGAQSEHILPAIRGKFVLNVAIVIVPSVDLAVKSQVRIAHAELMTGEAITANFDCLLHMIVQAIGTMAESTRIPEMVILH
jgi:hypothetical protein